MVFEAIQKDTAEYMHVLISGSPELQVIWDTRASTVDGIRLRTQGGQPIPIPIESEHAPALENLQDLIQNWYDAHDTTALTQAVPLILLQLGRYGPRGKVMTPVDLPESVLLPVFTETSSVIWHRYWAVGAVLHLGRTTSAGHYRAILKVGAQWFLADDAKAAVPVALHTGHHRNVYLIVLTRSQPSLPPVMVSTRP